MSIHKPNLEKFNAYFKNYVNLVETNDLLSALESNLIGTKAIFDGFLGDKENLAYAEGKWSVKQVLTHIIDVERVFAYRALRFSRQDATELSAYDDDLFVKNSNSHNRNLSELIEEFFHLRKSTISLSPILIKKCLILKEEPIKIYSHRDFWAS
jgi:hypothetical protein